MPQSKLNINDLTAARRDGDEKYQHHKRRLKTAYDREFELCGKDFWYWAQFVRTEDEDAGEVRSFPCDYEYLLELKHLMDTEQKIIILKARRLMISWLMMLDHLHDAMFAGSGIPGTLDVFRGGIMSIGQTEAEYLMQRIERAYKRFPDWMRERSPVLVDNKMYKEYGGGGTIQAFPLKREGPQTFGFTKVGFDEMALQEAVRTVWTGLIPTLGAKGKLFAVSTPNGKGNLYADIWFNKDSKYPGIYRKKIRWNAHPEHDEAWFKKTTEGMDQQMIARMFELSFAAYYGDMVWNSFIRQMHVSEKPLEASDSTVFWGWDHGFHFPAVTWWQRNSRDQWVGLNELQGFDMSFDDFVREAIVKANTFYERGKLPEIHCCPPDARNAYRTQSGFKNDIQVIKQLCAIDGRKVQIRFGTKDVGTRENEAARLKETRETFKMRADKEPGMYVDERMERFIEGCQGGYCYPEKGGEKPLDNEYAHVQCSYQAVVTAYNRMFKPKVDGDKTKERKRELAERRRDPFRTGLPNRYS